MVRKYKDIVDSIDPNAFTAPPVKKVKYYAYKNGNSRVFDTVGEASSYSHLYEKVVTNQDEIKKFCDERESYKAMAREIWEAELRSESLVFSDAQFQIVLDKAIGMTESCYLDDVVDNFDDLAIFVIKFMSAK